MAQDDWPHSKASFSGKEEDSVRLCFCLECVQPPANFKSDVGARMKEEEDRGKNLSVPSPRGYKRDQPEESLQLKNNILNDLSHEFRFKSQNVCPMQSFSGTC